jgi:putative ABC transport system permease protein
VDALIQTLRHATRSLARTPGFTATCVLTLALGIGATTAVFSVVYGVALRPLPYPNAARIVRVIQVLPLRNGETEPARAGISPEQLRDWRSQTLSGIALLSTSSATLTGISAPVRLNGAQVSPALFSILGVRPLMGRTFVKQEEQRGSDPTVVLGYRTWVEQFGSDARILDRSIELNGTLRRVVGVMPDDFIFPERGAAAQSGNSTGRLEGGPDFWVPFQLSASPGRRAGGFSLAPTVALVREGVSLQQATAEANSSIPSVPTGGDSTLS